MALSELSGKNVPIKIWSKLDQIEHEALNQLKNTAALPWVFKHVAAMPDCHAGHGVTVGSVIAMKDAVSPAAVGVDIGCGMGAIKTNLHASDLPDNLKNLRLSIEEHIPVGFNAHDKINWNWSGLEGYQLKVLAHKLFDRYDALDECSVGIREKAQRQLGTLGGGNHFIELCLDENQNVWMMLHSGSRNIGKTLAEKHISVARKLAHNQSIPDPELAVFLSKTPEMARYSHDLFWAQEYAFLNRRAMFELYKGVMRHHFSQISFEDPILCHHNYVSNENHFGEDVVVTRKGAISAAAGQLGIIPGSMGTKSYIVEGLGNPESFRSASHGAGRIMSRGAAKRKFTITDLEMQTAGVECRKDADIIDEIPGAYKDIDQVMENQKDLVKVRATLKAVLCVKGGK